MFSAVALDLHTFLPEKIAEIKQKAKSSGEKLTLKNVLNYTAKVAVIITCAGVIIGCWRFIRNYEAQTKELQKLNNETIPSIRKAVDNHTGIIMGIEYQTKDQNLKLMNLLATLEVIKGAIRVKVKQPTNTNGKAKPEGNAKR